MLFMGTFLGTIANIVVFVPLLTTTLRIYEIDSVHFGVIMVLIYV